MDPPPLVLAVGRRIHVPVDNDWGVYLVGEVIEIDDSGVLVDFYDWTERWPVGVFGWHELLPMHYVVTPSGDGQIVEDFRPQIG
jgi:hypothetical protein